tara:strand:- start:132 stop:569 length:438 start_codon:yes stop_codon:yes gene_type:complete
MKVEITTKQAQPLLKRQCLSGSLTFEKATPSNKELQEALAKECKTDAKVVVIRTISTHYGKTHADFRACVYESEEAMKTFQPKVKVKEKKEGEEAKPAEKPEEKSKQEDKPAAEPEKKEEKAEAKQKPKEEAKPEAKPEPKEAKE